MKVGIDTQATRGPQSGLGVFTTNLVEAVAACSGGEFQIFQYCTNSDKRMNTPQRLWWENVLLPLKVARDKIDLLHVPAFAPPALKPNRLVVTVHDIIGVRFANQLGGASRFYWKYWLPERIKQSDMIVADSFYTKGDLVQHLGLEPSSIRVIYPSGHEGFTVREDADARNLVLNQLKIPQKPYFLFVGTIEPRKNLKTALQAFLRLKEMHRDECEDLNFVVVGAQDFGHGHAFRELLQGVETNKSSIHFTGYVSHDELNELYSGATSFVFPSLYEGFGMPVLEAMASGTAVITSKTTSLPEVAGDSAVLVNPQSVEEVMEAMYSLYKSKGMRNDFVKKGHENIKRFSWEQSACQLVDVYREVLGNAPNAKRLESIS